MCEIRIENLFKFIESIFQSSGEFEYCSYQYNSGQYVVCMNTTNTVLNYRYIFIKKIVIINKRKDKIISSFLPR